MVKKLFISLMTLIPVTVLAGFQVVEETHRPAPSAVAGVSSASSASVQLSKSAGGMQLVALTYMGEPDADIPVINGFGRDLKLSEAIKQIVPAGWHAFLKEDMATRAGKFGPVSWKGGRRWIEVLDIFANDQNLAIDVDWTKKHLYVGEKQLSTAASNVKNAKRVITPPTIWALTAGQTVGHELQAWGEKAGWKVIWNMQKDWSVPASTKFEGEFPVVAAEVIKTLASNGALIRAQFFEGNKTMVVTGPGVSE